MADRRPIDTGGRRRQRWGRPEHPVSREGRHVLEAIGRQIEDRRDDLVSLTSDLIRVPTINPPGEAYRECCDIIARRLAPLGFEATFVRAEGTPGDSDRYPRWNVVARREGRSRGPCVHFNSHIDVVEAGQRLEFRSVRRCRARTADLRSRRLRHERRARHLDRRGRGVSATFVPITPAPSKYPARRTRSPAAMAASPISPKRAFSPGRASTT